MPSHDSSSSGPRSPVVRVFDCHVCRNGEGALEFLLLRRASDKIYAGTLRMVGGKLKEGEKAWEGCLRELREETGLKPLRLVTVPYINRFYEWQADRINDIPVFVALVGAEAKVQLDDEHVEALWVSSAEACRLLSWPAQREGLLAAEKMLNEESSLIEYMEVQIPEHLPDAEDA